MPRSRRKVAAKVTLSANLGRSAAEIFGIESRRLARKAGLSVAAVRIRRLEGKPRPGR